MRPTKTKAHGLSLRALTTTLVLALLASLLLGATASAAGFKAPPSEANESGRLDTASLYDLGGRTSALYAFSSGGSTFTKKLFWKSAKGQFDAAKAKLACGDLNADGYPDALVLYNRGGGKSALYAFLSDGSKYMQTTAWSGALAWGRAKLCVGDMNGDGLDDAYVLAQASKTRSAVYGFTSAVGAAEGAAPAPVTMTRSTLYAAASYAWDRAQIAASDVNADGKDELVSLYRVSPSAARLDVFAAAGAKLQRSSWWQGALQAARAKLACGDVGSDGKGDAVLLMNAGRRSSSLLVAKSTGTAFSAPTSWWKSAAGALDWASATLACGDVTSDGRADAVALSATSPTKAKLTVAVSDGSAFAATTFWAGALRTARARLACAASTPTVIPPTTEVLTPPTVAGAATADGSTYTFSDAAQTAGLSAGDVIVAEPTAALPEGIFRKVTAVASGGAAVMTEAAYLEDALECAQFSADHAITESDFTDAATTVAPGVRLIRSRADGADSRLLTFRLTDVGISKSWGLGADLGPVTVSGTITLRITVHVSGDVDWGGVKSFVASETTTVSTDLKASVTKELSFTTEKTLATWGAGQLTGFTVWVGAPPVVVPLYFQPELSIFVGANGEFGVGVETSVHYEASGTLGLRYQDGNFTTLTGFSRSASYVPPTLYASGSLKGYAGAQLGLKLYAAAGPFMRLDGYAKLAADTRATPWWTLKAGLEAGIGAQIGINVGFIHWNKDWRSGDLTLAEWTLAQAPTSTPPPIGQPYGGGVVAYILVDGDPGYVPGETHGLIAATADQSAGIQWEPERYWFTAAPGAAGTAIGTGSPNTNAIIAQNGAGVTYAAGLARAYNGGGYSDWYLPSQDELDKLYLNHVAIGGFDTTSHPCYWSSSEIQDYPPSAWSQNFDDGHQHFSHESNPHRVRAVRSF